MHETVQRPELGGGGGGERRAEEMELRGSVMNEWGRQGSLVVEGQRRWGVKMLISHSVPWVDVSQRGPGEL